MFQSPFIGLSLLAFLLSQAPEPDAVRQQLERARRLASTGQVEEAIAIYESLVAGSPEDARFRVNLAIVLFKAGRYKQAAEQSRAALAREPKLAAAWLFLGASQLRLGRAAEALEPLRRAVAAMPADRNARLMLAEALLLTGKPAEAVAHFEALVETLGATPRLWYGLERSYQALAAEALAELERRAPASPYLAALAGETYLERRQLRPAFRYLRQAAAELDSLPGLHAALAEVYRETGYADWAATAQEKERTASSDCATAKRPGCLFLEGRYRELITEADSPEALYWRIRAARRLARQAHDRLAALGPSAELHELNARRLDALGRPLEAAAEWRKALELAPEDPVLEKGLAVALLNGRDFRGASPLLEKLRAREPDSPELAFLTASAYLGLEQPDRALALLEATAARDTNHPGVRGALGQAYLTLGRYREAIPHLEAALAEDADGARHFQLAQALRFAGDAARAREVLARYQQVRQQAEARLRELESAAITPP